MALSLYVLLSLCVSVLGVSNLRRCADAECKVPISFAQVKMRYTPSEGEKLKLKIGQVVTVYSKEAGTDASLWGIEVDGKRGYAPSSFLKETKTFHKVLKYEVSTKIESSSATTGQDNNTPEENTSSVPSISNSFDVVDGTTLYPNSADDVMETQPIKNIGLNVQLGSDIQSTKTIDATSISKNKLDEPNSSLIVPQSTTSSIPLYSANGGDNLRINETDKPKEEVKKSTSDELEIEVYQEMQNDRTVEENENLSKDNNIGSGEMEKEPEFNKDTGREQENLEDSLEHDNEAEEEDEGMEDEDDEEGEEEEEEEEEEEDYQDGVSTGSEEQVDRTKEEEKEQQTFGGKGNDEIASSPTGTVNVDHQEPDSSEPQFGDSSVERTESLAREPIEASINNEPQSNIQDKVYGENRNSSDDSDKLHGRIGVSDAETASTPVNESAQFSVGDSASPSAIDDRPFVSDKNNNGMMETNIYINVNENNEIRDSSETSAEDDVLGRSEKQGLALDHGSNTKAFEDSAGDSTPASAAVATDVDQREKQEGKGMEEGGYVLNFFSSFGKSSESIQGDDSEEVQDHTGSKEGTELPENSKLPDSSDMTNDVLTEQVPLDGTFDDIPNQYTSEEVVTQQFISQGEADSIENMEPSPDIVLESPLSAENELNSQEEPDSLENTDPSPVNMQESPLSTEQYEVNNVISRRDGMVIDPVQSEDMRTSEDMGTCEMSSDCMTENKDLLEELSSEEDSKQGWFSSLTGRTSFDSEYYVSKEVHKNSLDTLLYLMVTAITVLVFSLGYYYIEKQRRDGSLIAKINNLEKALMVSSQEKFELKDELENTKERLSSFSTSPDSVDSSNAFKDELEEMKIARAELEEQVASLEKELEAATEAGLELNRMMSELLSAQNGSDTLMKSVEHLQKQLDSQQSTISTMNACLTAKSLENENLQSELNLASEKVQNLEEQLCKVNESLTNLQKEKSEIEHDFLMKNKSIESQLVDALESKSADSQRLCRELDALQDVLDETRKTLAAREGEVSVLRECLSHAECLSSGGEPNISLEALLDVGHLRAKVDTVTKERDELQEKLQGEEDARKLLEDHMKIVSEEVSTLRTKYEEADRGKMEAQTRLEVLSNYFKEKETQLQKELGLQEAMYIQKEGDALSTIEQIKAFQEEIENYKAQNEMLKKEIVDQERSMKSQIGMLEKKAHENWVAARQAERRLEESKQESSQLRNRLTLSGRRVAGTIPGPDIGKPPERGTLDLERNGEMSSSPAHMGETQELPSSPLHFGLPASPPLLPPGGQPLPPGPFPNMPPFLPPGIPFPMPPPPGGLFPDDLRPPPLGRMSSPPPEPHGSFSPFDRSPPMSPPNRPYRSPIHYEDSPSRYRHQTPPSSGAPSFAGPFPPGKWDDRNEPPRSSFRPLHRDSAREPKGSTLSSGHSSESLDKGGRHSRV